jgi:hypothetical protein
MFPIAHRHFEGIKEKALREMARNPAPAMKSQGYDLGNMGIKSDGDKFLEVLSPGVLQQVPGPLKTQP